MFLGRREMSKFLTGRGTFPFSFPSREHSPRVGSKNLSTDVKEIE